MEKHEPCPYCKGEPGMILGRGYVNMKCKKCGACSESTWVGKECFLNSEELWDVAWAEWDRWAVREWDVKEGWEDDS